MLFLIPAPLYTTTEGVVWLPENAVVRAGTDGFVRALLVEPGKIVTAGEALVESEEPTLKAELEILRARVAELETRLATERFTDRVRQRSRPPNWGKREPSSRPQPVAPSVSLRAVAARAPLRS